MSTGVQAYSSLVNTDDFRKPGHEPSVGSVTDIGPVITYDLYPSGICCVRQFFPFEVRHRIDESAAAVVFVIPRGTVILFSLLDLFDFIVRGFFECVGVEGGVGGELDGEALDFVDDGFSTWHVQIENMSAAGSVF